MLKLRDMPSIGMSKIFSLRIRRGVLTLITIAGLAFINVELFAGVLFVKNENRVVLPGERLGDVVVIDGELTVSGGIRGAIRAVSSRVILTKDAIVGGLVSVTNGSLIVENKIALPAKIQLINSYLKLENKIIRTTKEFNVKGVKGVSFSSKTVKNNKTTLHDLKRLLTFVIPQTSLKTPKEIVKKISVPQIDGVPIRTAALSQFELLEGLLKIDRKSGMIEAVAQSIWGDNSRKVRFTALKANDTSDAQQIYEMLRTLPEKHFKYSYHLELGENGKHWLLGYNGWEVVIWQSGFWVMVVQAKVYNPHDLLETKDFLNQAVEGFRQQIK